ncbi:MAG: alpha/beta hydrolase [Phycisphaerales bacterium]|nr:MAG: alpha/beta hydrolase [Phycisphaerales bacterium]
MISILIYICLVLVTVYCAWGVVLFLMQPRFLYSPTREITCTPRDCGLDFEDVAFETDDGLQLSGWYIPAGGSETTVLFCHGNAGNIMHRLDSIRMFYALGLNCLIFDYRGYGKSEGKPGEKGTYLDARAAYRWLIEQKAALPEDIIVFGRSLGGSIAANLASQVTVGGLVVESAFTSYVDIGKRFYPYMPVRLFARFRYNTLDYIGSVRCPVMLIYSKDDEIVLFEFGLRLYEAATEPKRLVETFGSHNDHYLVSAGIYREAWIDWLHVLEGTRERDCGTAGSSVTLPPGPCR